MGYIALPGLLTYFNAGYTEAHFKGTNFIDINSCLAALATGVRWEARPVVDTFLVAALNTLSASCRACSGRTKFVFPHWSNNKTYTLGFVRLLRLWSWSCLDPDEPRLTSRRRLPSWSTASTGWPGRRQVLIVAKSACSKAPASSGAFLRR